MMAWKGYDGADRSGPVKGDILRRLKDRVKTISCSTEAEVRDIVEKAASDLERPRRSLLSLIGSAPSSRTIEEIVADIRALRDEWD